MKVAGIIMECNPFHEGHGHILKKARQTTEADYVIAVISGDFVQRGEPAVFDKYKRAGRILEAGADLVLELPLPAACGSAEYFAQGSISLLEKLGPVTDLCFGSESADLAVLRQMAGLLDLADHAGTRADTKPGLSSRTPDPASSALFQQRLLNNLRTGLPFPAARAAALEKVFKGTAFPSSSNDLLAVEYCRVLLQTGSSIRPHAIPRIPVPSATDRRRDLICGRDLRADDPGRQDFPVCADDFSSQLLYALIMEEAGLERFADVSPQLAARIRKNLPSFRTYTDFCHLVKTRNLTYTRVSRSLLHILLRLEKDRLQEWRAAGMALYARPLAMRRDAAPLLAEIKRRSSIPFLSRLSRASSLLSPLALSFLQEEIQAEELYDLTAARVYAKSSRTLRAAERPIVIL